MRRPGLIAAAECNRFVVEVAHQGKAAFEHAAIGKGVKQLVETVEHVGATIQQRVDRALGACEQNVGALAAAGDLRAVGLDMSPHGDDKPDPQQVLRRVLSMPTRVRRVSGRSRAASRA